MSFALRVGLITSGLLATAVAFGSCAVPPFELVDGVGGAGGGSGGSSSSTGGGGSGGCGHLAPPPPPGGTDDGGSEEVTVALRVVDFGDDTAPQGSGPGYDLDRLCTCDGEPPSCVRPSWLSEDPCDLQGGVDNDLAFMFATGGSVSDRLSSTFHTANMGSGLYSLLVHVTGYNGMADDPKVTVALYPSAGLAKDPCNGAGPTPMWNGSDVWPILDSATTLQGSGGSGGAGGAGGGGPVCSTGFDIADAKFVDSNAYVTGNVLVASLPQAQLIFDSVAATVLVDITSVVLSARLEQVTGGWGLRDGTLAGIIEFEEMFRGIAELITSGDLVCTSHQLYNLIKTAVCQVPDITATLAGPTDTCDAVSVGMGFTIADPITLGTVIPTPPGPGTCPMGEAPEDDGCENHF